MGVPLRNSRWGSPQELGRRPPPRGPPEGATPLTPGAHFRPQCWERALHCCFKSPGLR